MSDAPLNTKHLDSILAELERRIDDLSYRLKEKQESESRLRSFIESSTDSFVLLDEKLRFIETNQANLDVINLKREDVIGKNLLDVLPELRQTGREQLYINVLETGETYETEYEGYPGTKGRTYSLKVFKVGTGLGMIIRDVSNVKVRLQQELKHFEELKYLSNSATHLVEFGLQEDLFHYTANCLSDLTDGAYIVVTEFDKVREEVVVKELKGLKSGVEVAVKLIGKQPVGMTFPEYKNTDILLSGKLTKIDGGLHTISANHISEDLSSQLHRLLKIGHIFTIGIAYKEELLGSALILVQKGKELNNLEMIETFVKQVSIAIQRKHIQDQLKQSEMRFRSAFNLIPGFITLTRLEDQLITEVNEEFYTTFNFKPGDVYNRRVVDLGIWLNPGDRENWLLKTTKQKLVRNYVARLKRSGGETFDALLSSNIIQLGNRAHILTIGRDISQRVRSENALRRSEERYRLIMDNAFEAIFVAQDKKIKFFNKRLLELTGYAVPELDDQPFEDKIYSEDREMVLSRHEKRLKGEKVPNEYSLRVVDKKKNIHWVELSSVVIEWEGKPATLNFMRDVTEKHNTEQALRASEIRYRKLIENAPIGVLSVDIFGNIIDANPALIAILGAPSMEELKLHNALQELTFFDSGISSTMKKCMDENISLTYEHPFRSHWGKEVYLRMMMNPMHNKEGKVTGVQANVEDITSQKEYVATLKSAMQKAEESDRLKSSFLSNMSHEIRTPMNAIVGFSDLLADPSIPSADRNKYSKLINQNGEKLLKLIDDIIDIARIEAGELPIQNQLIHPKEIVDAMVVEIKESRKRMNKQSIKIVSKVGQDILKVKLYSDPIRIRQVIVNLMDNALKFTEKGQVTLGCTLERKREELLFYVKDTGIGIAESDQEIIFDRFRQSADSDSVVNSEGTGLGLSISRRIIEILGGELWVESEMHKGSTFYFSLPLTESELTGEIGSRHIRSGSQRWSNKTILIAEDVESNFELIYSILKPTKAKLYWAKDGKEAVKLFKELKTLDLVIMDIRMPIMNGYQATSMIKSINKDIPVVALTAYAMEEEKIKSYDAGCDAHLSKPVRSNTLLTTLERYINK